MAVEFGRQSSFQTWPSVSLPPAPVCRLLLQCPLTTCVPMTDLTLTITYKPLMPYPPSGKAHE